MGDDAAAYRSARRRLWGLAYRLTGSSADADDIVQETFVRWLARSPEETPPVGWLVRVATRLAIDTLRARRRRRYDGAWLPAPAARSDDDWRDTYASGEPAPEYRYDLLESVTFAFLVALETLDPRQRAVVVLRDVLGHSAAETAACIGTTEGNVRILHLRSRRALAGYDQARVVPSRELRERHRAALERLLAALAAQDARALEALLADDVRTVTDAGGEFTALAATLAGRDRVARLYLRATASRAAGGPTIDVRVLNGMPAAVIALATPVRRQAPLTVMHLELAPDGLVQAIHTVLASRKLTAL